MWKAASLPLAQLRAKTVLAEQAARETFLRTGDGTASIQRRTVEVDALLREIWSTLQPGQEPAIAVFALGGYGRRELFPASDIDVLFLCASEAVERDAHELIRTATQAIWDIGLRASPATRTLKECERLDGETNLEFGISLLDRRLLFGDAGLAARFENELLMTALLREAAGMEAYLAEAARMRHAKFGDTIFHLEPNIKECPGGMRDYQLIRWLQLLRHLAAQRAWPDRPGAEGFTLSLSAAAGNAESSSTGSSASSEPNDLESAFEFLAATRCFLHIRNGRDDNILDWVAQDEAAAGSVGLETLGSADPAYWMRTYYRHARTISRRATLLLDAAPPIARKPLLKVLRRRRSLVGGTNFWVEDNRITLEPGTSTDAESLLRVFAHIAQYGSSFREGTESRISESLSALAVHLPEGPYLWNCLRDVLLGPHAAHALRIMHALGLLELLLPEFHGIDSLVVRDAYHRYTVDEHTFLVIENVHALRTPRHEWEKRFSTLLPEIERRDLLMLALLLHDTGKARRTGDHARESIELAERVFTRLEFDLEERDIVRRLIRNHLEMSHALRRDIFDPESIRAFSEHAPGQQQLKMLTLLTFADIKAVHPDALTPWKAENIWQLYIATANYLDRSVDEIRYHVDADPVVLARILSRVAVHGGFAAQDNIQNEQLRSFLEGMPQRYLQTRLPDQIGEHFKLSLGLASEPIQLAFRLHRQFNEVTLITRDRPMLFADMAGALSAWGMNIVKADAFSNSAGIILDSFQFTDPFRTLELNPGEHERFLKSLRSALRGEIAIEGMLRSRQRPRHGMATAARTRIVPRFHFDNQSSSHSTLLQVVAPDSPGLLRALSAAIAICHCNIEVALIDTEGELAIDVFYLTTAGRKLQVPEEACMTQRIEEALSTIASDQSETASIASPPAPAGTAQA
ncbi:HD domain-containing protein [Acidipila sp. EB88]|uniref:[protein-PII] uridylyltransferase family protein n=1 Tax=Acidipila sp. EB88 TaxID=2305226 RepID=UPI000F5EAABF|nr:HD domain-containing protein [Acidipila sp. EB88]RRA47120.1 HD domain-containing protein [Acidipila sp. EB88]